MTKLETAWVECYARAYRVTREQARECYENVVALQGGEKYTIIELERAMVCQQQVRYPETKPRIRSAKVRAIVLDELGRPKRNLAQMQE